MRILRKILAGLARDCVLVFADQIDPVLGGEVGVERVALAVLEGVEDFLEMMMLEAEHHVRIHGDEAAIAVIGEAAVARQFRQRFHGLVVEAEIEHGVHHARHRGAAAGANRNEQRVPGIAEALAGQLADMRERLLNLRLQFLRVGFVVRVEIGADRGRDGEARRHRQAEIGHLGEVGALAAEQVAHLRFALGLPVPERIDPLAGLGRNRRCLGRRSLARRGLHGELRRNRLGRCL
ncbi:hypothetical protein ACVWW3_000480 [Bradyrhizobium sp. LM2.9]